MTPPAALPLPEPEVSLYRDHCIALLRRYFCMSVEIGRLPAILGRECFRTRAQDYHVHSFENMVLFVIDVERCLDRLHPFDRELVARIVLQEHTEEEAARLLHCGLRTIERRLPEALDALTEMFLAHATINIADRVPRYRLLRRESPAGRRKRVPQRTRIQAQADTTLAGRRSSLPLVKPPKPENFSYRRDTQANIFLPDVAGLPS